MSAAQEWFEGMYDEVGRTIRFAPDGPEVRALVAAAPRLYEATEGVTTRDFAFELTCLVSEIPPNANLDPGGGVWMDDSFHRIHQDIPALPVDGRGVILKITVHAEN